MDIEKDSVEYFVTPLDSIPLDVPLPFSLHVRVNEKYIKFREVNDTLSTERILSLGQKVDSVFIQHKAWTSFLDYLESVCDISVKNPEVAAKNIHSLLVAYGQHLEQMQILEQKTVNKLRKVGYRLADLSLAHPEIQGRLLKRYNEISVYFSNHSANVAVYSIAIAKKLGFSPEQIRELSFACLVHNVGYSLVPHAVIYKKEKFTDEEKVVMQGHVEKGAQLLEYMNAPSEVVATVRQHHEHMDGKGYPNHLFGEEIHPFARICSIADVYDALLSKKPYGKEPLTPKAAIQEMQAMAGKFDPEILKMI